MATPTSTPTSTAPETAAPETTAAAPPPPRYTEIYSSGLYRRRRVTNRAALTLSVTTMGIGIAFLLWILWTLAVRGIVALRPIVFLQSTPGPGSDGGLINAIVGSLLMIGAGTLVGAPVGILAGTYLAEFGKSGWFAEIARFVNDILLSAPSIIIGLCVYAVMVMRMGHFSGWAGAAALAIIAIPIVVRTTEDMLRLVPVSLREAAAALGAPRWKVVVLVAYRAARSGILTGVLLAIARISGETAPLLFTALNNQFWSTNMNAPIANLPSVIFNFANSAYPDWQKLAWTASLLITLSVLVLNVVARIVFRQQKAG
ncbi:MAG TPA: phosphate ABC transporter permease PstA [Thermoanaerobaculia bacterium]|nr:phosphate ABC transporter permease PstA [Thermoanaerobaculia bacterium]